MTENPRSPPGRDPGTSHDPTQETSAAAAAPPQIRREFLGTLATGITATVGLAGTAVAEERPVVSMGNNYFDPIGLFVESGTTVRFEVQEGSHSATAYPDRIPKAATAFDSGILSEGSFEHTLETPGTYDYYCTPHQSMGMVGRIVVQSSGGPAEESPSPDGAVPGSDRIVADGNISSDAFEGGADGDRGRRGMKRSGMMAGDEPGWMMLMPIGFLTGVLGLAGGILYSVAKRATPEEEAH